MALEDEIQVGEPIVERGSEHGGVQVDQSDFQRHENAPPAQQAPITVPVQPEAHAPAIASLPDDAFLAGQEPEFVPEHAAEHDRPMGPAATLVFGTHPEDEQPQVAEDGTPLTHEHHQPVQTMTDGEALRWCVAEILALKQAVSQLTRTFYRATGIDPNTQ